MAAGTLYELELKLGASTSPSWKTTLGKVESGLKGVNSLSTRIMSGLAAGVAAAAATATYAISNAVDTYTSFEQEMAVVQSISGASATEFLAMEEAALAAGSSTVFTATEAASALEYMSLAGWDADTSMSALTPILRLAAATGKELQTTSDLVTDSMNALGIGVDGLNMYLDKLIQGNNSASTSAEELMEALARTGGSARTIGADLDDTITALGVLANNSVKGTEAGTALNAMLVRLIGNTTALKELKKLGVSLFDDKGFVGLEEGLTRINQALSGIKDDGQRTLSLKNIAGTHYYSQLAYLLDAVKQDENGMSAWDELKGKVADSTGALDTMYDITTDTLENAQKRLQSAKEDMQIRLVDVFSDDAKDFVSWLAESLPNVTESLVDFAEAHQGEFARALEGLGEGIENLWEFGISAGQWIIRHKGAIIGALSGMASGMVVLKTAMMGIDIARFFTNPVSAAVTAAGLAVTAFSGIKGAIRDAEEAAVNADLASQFGSIALSMKDIDQVAEHIVGSANLTGVYSALEQFDELDSISAVMEDSVKELDKIQWKISIGMELSEADKEEFQKAIDDYVSSAQEYAEQTQYAVSLNMQYAFDADFADAGNIMTKVNQFYADNSATMAQLGTDLNAAMTEAFNDGLLDIYEVEHIAEIQKQMADIQAAMAVGKFEGQMSALGMEYSGKDLTPESFMNLMGETDNLIAEGMEAYTESYADNYSAIKATYAAGKMSYDEYNEGINALQTNYANQKAELQLQSMEFLINTIYDTYGDEIAQYEDAVSNVTARYNDASYNASWETAPGSTFDTMLLDIASEGPSETKRHAVGELLKNTSAVEEALYALRDDFDSMSPEIQAEIQSMTDKYETLKGMSASESDLRSGKGNDEIYRNVANEVLASSNNTVMKQYVSEYYEDLTGYTLEASTEKIPPVIDGVYAYSQEYLDQVFSDGLSASTVVNLTIDPAVKMMGYAGWYRDHSAVLHNAKGGIYNSPILTTFAEEGPEAALPLDGSERAKQLWMQAGEILGMLPVNVQDNPILILQQAEQSSPDGMYQSILHNEQSNAGGIYQSILHNAEGGIYNSPILTTFAEEGPEAALPLDGSERAKQLWMQAGEMLGMLPGNSSRDQVLLDSVSSMPREDNTRGSIQIVFSPNITIQGAASRDEVMSAMTFSIDKLREMLDEIKREDRRTAFE